MLYLLFLEIIFQDLRVGSMYRKGSWSCLGYHVTRSQPELRTLSVGMQKGF